MREKNSKAVVKEVVVSQDMTQGGVSLHVVSNEMVEAKIKGSVQDQPTEAPPNKRAAGAGGRRP